mgnify:CR=1 FL=1
MNAKCRLDLYRLNVPQFKNSMVIGIDLIMNGNSKLIGCSATSNKNLTQCFTKLIKHKLPKLTEEIKYQYPNKSRREVQEILTSIERAEIIKNFVYEAVGNYNKETKTLPE